VASHNPLFELERILRRGEGVREMCG
jgi:hypothetical protein